MNFDFEKNINLLDKRYFVREWKHSIAILRNDFPNEFKDILEILNNFELFASDITKAGGRKSPIASKIDSKFYDRDWEEKEFDIKIQVDDLNHDTPTHKIDCYKNRIALEVEWNNKDPFFDRDLNNFRLLHELEVISVGVIVTRCRELQDIFKELGKGASYGSSTTHTDKLIPRIEGKGAGGCPLLVIGISKDTYSKDI